MNLLSFQFSPCNSFLTRETLIARGPDRPRGDGHRGVRPVPLFKECRLVGIFRVAGIDVRRFSALDLTLDSSKDAVVLA